MDGIGVFDVARAFWYAARHQRAVRDEVVSYQDAQLRRLIAHAYANVPYYRTLFQRHGVEPDHVRTAADLARIPVTSRRDLQAAPPSGRLARGVNPSRLIVHRTSGSTGEPLHVRRTWLEERITTAFRLRALRDFGVRVRDTRAWFVLPRAADPRNWDGLQQLIRALGLYRRARLDRRARPRNSCDGWKRCAPTWSRARPAPCSASRQPWRRTDRAPSAPAW